MPWKVLVPDKRGNLIPTPESLAPPMQLLDDEFDESDDDLEMDPSDSQIKPASVTVAPSPVSDSTDHKLAPAGLNPLAARLDGLLQYRDDILDISADPAAIANRDELIEALATRVTRLDRIGGRTTIDPDSYVISIIDGRLDSIFDQLQKVDRDRSDELDEARSLIRAADRLRHRLPLHLARLIDLVYYQHRTAQEAAGALCTSLDRFNALKTIALTDLAERVMMRT